MHSPNPIPTLALTPILSSGNYFLFYRPLNFLFNESDIELRQFDSAVPMGNVTISFVCGEGITSLDSFLFYPHNLPQALCRYPMETLRRCSMIQSPSRAVLWAP